VLGIDNPCRVVFFFFFEIVDEQVVGEG
jgi:hypothetical protein